MNDLAEFVTKLPAEGKAVGPECFSPLGPSVNFNETEFEHSIPERFEEYVEQYRDRLAFKSKRLSFTWEGLNQAANRVARAILEKCLNRERPIALMLDHGASIVAGMGVLKTGGFYLPLTPSHPLARNGYILRETEAPLILTDSTHLSIARELAGKDCQVLDIDVIDSNISKENLGLHISADSISYITYTSGSTGEPKGVINTHRKVLYGIVHNRYFELGAEDRYANIGSGGRNPFSALLSGAASFPWYVRDDGLACLADWLIQEEITVCRVGPRVFRQFVSTLTGKEDFPKLRIINLAGEPLSITDVELYKKHFPSSCLLVNTFGAHEVGPFRVYAIGKETSIAGDVVPVGYAIPGKEVLLLDNNGQQIGCNQIGEITVKSRYLSLGYWRSPDLTKSKFLPDPDGGDCRIYLTGDLGRMLPDGCLEHHGRKDFQAKIRGFRVDFSEVEKALLEHPGVREATISARMDRSSEAQLVAYFVSSTHFAPTVSSLRNFLKEKVPDYMIPSVFVRLDEIPLTATGTGKVDRRALPDPGWSRPKLDTPFYAPKTPVEVALGRIWAEVLNLDDVGTHDNFFDLGGHSLAATQVISRVLKKFQLEIPLQALFQSPTVAEMATVVAEHQATKLVVQDVDRILSELESLTDQEAQQILAGAMNEKKR